MVPGERLRADLIASAETDELDGHRSGPLCNDMSSSVIGRSVRNRGQVLGNGFPIVGAQRKCPRVLLLRLHVFRIDDPYSDVPE